MCPCGSLMHLVRRLSVALLFAGSYNCMAVEVGQVAPDFKLNGTDATVTLKEFRGQVVYLDFWASWCAPCRHSFPWMNAMQSKFHDKGLRIVAINLDETKEATNEFLTKLAPNFKIAFDPVGNTPKTFDVLGMPTSFLIGKDGKVIFRHAGFKSADRAALEIRIGAALAGP